MKKYTLEIAIAVSGQVKNLLIEGDVVYAELVGSVYHVYNSKTKRQLGFVPKDKFETAITPQTTDVPVFVNSFRSWVDTYTEILGYIKSVCSLPLKESVFEHAVIDTLSSSGFTGLVDLAMDWTKKFEILNKDRFWDGEFYSEVEAFARSKDLGTDFQEELDKLEASVITEGEVDVYPAFEGETFTITGKQKTYLLERSLIHVSETVLKYFPEDLEEIKQYLSQ